MKAPLLATINKGILAISKRYCHFNYASKRFGFKMNNYKGNIVPAFVTTSNMDYLRNNFSPQSNDVFITCMPKSGTNWMLKWCMEIMVHSQKEQCHPFYNNGGIWRDIPWIEQYISNEGQDAFNEHCHSLKNELRFWSTHCSLHICPYKHSLKQDRNHKIIYLCRNPKDVVLSSYPFYSTHPWLGFDKNITFDSFFEMFIAGLVPFDAYFKHVYHWYMEYKYNNTNNNILWIYYEDMRQNPMDEIKKVVQFLGKQDAFKSEGDYRLVVEKSDINEMRKYSEQGLVRYAPTFFERGGLVDGWKTQLNQNQIDTMDDMIQSYFLGTDIKYVKELKVN